MPLLERGVQADGQGFEVASSCLPQVVDLTCDLELLEKTGGHRGGAVPWMQGIWIRGLEDPACLH